MRALFWIGVCAIGLWLEFGHKHEAQATVRDSVRIEASKPGRVLEPGYLIDEASGEFIKVCDGACPQGKGVYVPEGSE